MPYEAGYRWISRDTWKLEAVFFAHGAGERERQRGGGEGGIVSWPLIGHRADFLKGVPGSPRWNSCTTDPRFLHTLHTETCQRPDDCSPIPHSGGEQVFDSLSRLLCSSSPLLSCCALRASELPLVSRALILRCPISDSDSLQRVIPLLRFPRLRQSLTSKIDR